PGVHGSIQCQRAGHTITVGWDLRKRNEHTHCHCGCSSTKRNPMQSRTASCFAKAIQGFFHECVHQHAQHYCYSENDRCTADTYRVTVAKCQVKYQQWPVP